jgi:NTP pyrophosphatase (non-canonical NTP hydrolase)
LATHQELTEVMQSIDWKKYHTYNREYTKEETQEEIIDCFKFIMNLMIIWDIDYKLLVKLFNKKSTEVEQRYENK